MTSTPSLPRRGQMAALSAAGAAAAGLASAPAAQAAILYTDVADLTYNISSTGSIYFDLDQSSGVAPFASLSNFTGADFRLYGTSGNAEKPRIVGLNASSQIANSSDVTYLVNKFAANSPIGASYWLSSVGYLENNNSGYWQGNSGDAYLGLRLNAGGSNYRYGWARINYNDTANTNTLKDFAIEQTLNTPILAGAGAVPEPGRAVLLALGLGGAALRRRRKAA
jgi:hypothetical protein